MVGCTRLPGGEGWRVMRPGRGRVGQERCGAGLVRRGVRCGGIDDGAIAPVDFRTQRGYVHCSMSHICAQEQHRHGRANGGCVDDGGGRRGGKRDADAWADY